MAATTIEAPAIEGFRLSSERALGQLNPYPPLATEAATSLLQQHHTQWHMYFRDGVGHYHIPHAILTSSLVLNRRLFSQSGEAEPVRIRVLQTSGRALSPGAY